MFPINAALVSKFSAADYAPVRSNINAAAAMGPMASNTASPAADAPSAVSATDTTTSTVADRRYTKFDRSASQVGEADMSFSDVLDAVNPLQHIPVVSSVYRAVTNQPINPVSRITGDILYGGVFGLGSALLGTVGSVGDSIMISQTGRSMSGQAMAAVFGTDSAPTTTPDKDTSPILLADNKTSRPQSSVATGAPMVLVANKYTQPTADISAAVTAADVVADSPSSSSSTVTTTDDDAPHFSTPGAPVIMAGYAAHPPSQLADAAISAGTKQDQTISSQPETQAIIDTVTIEAPSSYVSAAAIAVTPEPLTPINTSTANTATVVADVTPQATIASNKVPSEQSIFAAKSYPINLNKQPYGGVMDMSGISTLAQTVAQDPHATQLGHTIYPSSTAIRPRLVAITPLTAPTTVTAPAAVAATTTNTADSATASTGTTSTDATEQALIRDLIALREFKQPPANIFAAPAPRGSLVDVKN